MRPLFIPLKSEYFEEFERGHKTIEYRRYGRQWSEKHCFPGRAVVLSRGYSGRRLNAVIERFETATLDSECYGPCVLLALIYLRLVPSSCLESL